MVVGDDRGVNRQRAEAIEDYDGDKQYLPWSEYSFSKGLAPQE
jgi:hypothetical protein